MLSRTPPPRRCAIYSRKSSEDGLEQKFNTLDAQHQACEAFIASQMHEGWQLVPQKFVDGGYSGGNMQRPGLQQLLSQIAQGKIDVVVVYKIDRLTRSLADFARMVELFDNHSVSFVSVTQSFSTTSSMGRLTLNVLLSFAQFEREVTGERIRDKIAASKAKGMWMGGNLPLGYDLPIDNSRTLVVNEAEARTVRLIFQKYVECGSVRELAVWLAAEKISAKRWQGAKGEIGGGLITRTMLYRMLRNEIYLGMIRHGKKLYPGLHPPLVERPLYDRVQHALDANRRRGPNRRGESRIAPLKGRIFDATGKPMSPTTSKGKLGVLYHYYVSQPGGDRPHQAEAGPTPTTRRVPAISLETELTILLTRLLYRHGGNPLALLHRVEIHDRAVHLVLPRYAVQDIPTMLLDEEGLELRYQNEQVKLIWNAQFRRRRATGETSARRRPDPVLVAALKRAHKMIDLDRNAQPICKAAPPTQYGRRLLDLALLAPDLQRAILEGTQPANLTLEFLVSEPLPTRWDEQRLLFNSV